MNMINIEQTYNVIPGKVPEFVEGLQQEYLPLAEDMGLRLVGFWEVAEFYGAVSCQVFGLWEIDTVQDYMKLVQGRYKDPVLSKRYNKWLEKQSNWVTELSTKTLAPSIYNRPLDQLLKEGRKAGAITREIINCDSGKGPHYMKYFHKIFEANPVPQGSCNIGSYRNVSDLDQITLYWDGKASLQDYIPIGVPVDSPWRSPSNSPAQLSASEAKGEAWGVEDWRIISLGFRGHWYTQFAISLFGPLSE